MKTAWILEQVPPVIPIEPQLGVGVGLHAGYEVGELLQRIAWVQGGEGFGDLRKQVLINIHSSQIERAEDAHGSFQQEQVFVFA
jgi:hypothetical protein